MDIIFQVTELIKTTRLITAFLFAEQRVRI